MNNNPYSSPEALLLNESYKNERKRNGWIWVILIYQCLSVFSMIMGSLVIYAELVPLPPEIQEQYDKYGTLDLIAIIISLVIVIFTIITLFNLRKSAVKFFIAEIVFSILMYIVNIFKNDLLDTYNAFSWIGMVVGYGIMFLILWYLLQLQKRGILR